MVLGHSLRGRGAKAKLAALVTVDNVSSETIEELRVGVLQLYPGSPTDHFLDGV
jgi:hypothetical protein